MLIPIARVLNANPASTRFLDFMSLIPLQLIHITTHFRYVVLSSLKAQKTSTDQLDTVGYPSTVDAASNTLSIDPPWPVAKVEYQPAFIVHTNIRTVIIDPHLKYAGRVEFAEYALPHTEPTLNS